MKYQHIQHLGLDDVMRNRYFVCYDVRDQQRLTQTYKKMRGYGDPVQYSVFMCELNGKEIIYMKDDLGTILNLAEDRLLIINVGPVNVNKKNVEVIGMSIDTEKEASIVI